jgi:AhpD family alkylhydroperoxidase
MKADFGPERPLSNQTKPGGPMSTVAKIQSPESDPRVKAVFDDIRATRRSDFINNMWHYLAFDTDLLENTWAEVKAVMATPSALDPLTKEMLYIAVSVTNGCGYCAHSHTAAAKAKGMAADQHADLLRVISLATKTNQLATALQVPVDPVFDADHRP